MSSPEGKTIIERLNEAEGTPEGNVMMTLLAVKDDRFIRALESRAQKRRHEYAKTLSIGDLNHSEVVDLIKEREDDFLDEYNIEPIPEPIMRMEAQDVLLEYIYERFVDAGIIEEGDEE